MIARIRQPQPAAATLGRHAAFLRMLPTIRGVARVAFAGLRAEAAEEAVAECVANATTATPCGGADLAAANHDGNGKPHAPRRATRSQGQRSVGRRATAP